MIRRDGLLDCLARAGRRHPSVGTWPDLRAVVAQTTYSDKGFIEFFATFSRFSAEPEGTGPGMRRGNA